MRDVQVYEASQNFPYYKTLDTIYGEPFRLNYGKSQYPFNPCECHRHYCVAWMRFTWGKRCFAYSSRVCAVVAPFMQFVNVESSCVSIR